MTDKMTQKSHEDMSKEINKDGVAVRTRGYHIWRVIFCIIGVLGMLMFIYPVLRGCHVNIGTLLGTGGPGRCLHFSHCMEYSGQR